MNDTQRNWREHFKNLEWVDMKGWQTKELVSDIYEEPDSERRYYADKVSFFKTIFRTLRRLLFTWFLSFVLLFIPSLRAYAAVLFLFGSLGIIIHAIYFLIRCGLEDNLRL